MSAVALQAKRRIAPVLLAVVLVVGGVMALTAAQAEAAVGDGLSATTVSAQASEYGARKKAQYDVAKGASKTYTARYGYTFIPVKSSGSGYANVKVSLSGLKDGSKVQVIDLVTNPKRDGSSSLMAEWTVKPDSDNSQVLHFRSTVSIDGTISVLVTPNGSVADNDKDFITVNVETTEFYPLTTKSRTIKPNEDVKVAQPVGKLYWKVKLSKPRVLTLTRPEASDDIVLCNAKKKVLPYDEGADSASSSGAYRYVLGKGTYFIRTSVDSLKSEENDFFRTLDIVSFSYKVSSIGGPIGKNTTLKKAKTISLRKKVTGVFASSPKAKRHYYKLSLKRDTKVSASYSGQYTRDFEITLCNGKGKYLSSLETGKKKAGKFTFEDGRTDEFGVDGGHTLTLPAGVYYIKVETSSSVRYGTYSFKLK